MPRTKESNQAQYRYNAAHLKRVPLDMQLEDYAEVKATAESFGKSVNGYIKDAVGEAVLRDTGKTIFQKKLKPS